MARLLEEYVEDPHPCPYLPDRSASLHVRIALEVSAGELDELLRRGWRRFGPVYFRPACGTCRACVPTRIPAATFHASRSQRRARKQSLPLARVIGRPIVDRERLDLYLRWHEDREADRGWATAPLDEVSYAQEFAFPHPSVREVSFRDPADGNRLVGLGIVDETPEALSAVYFFWDPEHAPSSLGTAHIVRLVDDAVERRMKYVYLGYRVDGCPSLAYKGRFTPQEGLHQLPASDDVPEWAERAEG